MALNTKNAERPDIVLCNYINRIADYKLHDPLERLFFDWLVMKSIGYGYIEFTRSLPEVEKDLGIGRKSQERMINLFSEMGFLTMGKKMVKDKLYRSFYVDFAKLTDKDILSKIIKSESANYGYFVEFFKYHAKMQNKAEKPTKAEVKQAQVDETNAKGLFKELIITYNERIGLYNNGELGDQGGKKPSRQKSETSYSYTKKIGKCLLALIEKSDLNKQSIKWAFISYTDAFLCNKMDNKPHDFFKYFLTYNDVDGSYPVVNKYLNIFNRNYSHG